MWFFLEDTEPIFFLKKAHDICTVSDLAFLSPFRALPLPQWISQAKRMNRQQTTERERERENIKKRTSAYDSFPADEPRDYNHSRTISRTRHSNACLGQASLLQPWSSCIV